MSDIIFLGDIHIGASKSSVPLHDHIETFFKDFFAYVDKNQIKSVVQVGDFFDVRNHITTFAAEFTQRVIIDEVQKRDLTFYVLVGNHDSYYKESIKLNMVREILGREEGFVVIDSPNCIKIEGTNFLVIPWVCKENEEEISKIIQKTNAKYCVGHFEFDGFELYRGHKAVSNRSAEEYSKFDLVISGHYHTSSRKDNVLYTGTPYELTWTDYKDPKGFWKFKDGNTTFIQNENTIHEVITYPQEFSEKDIKNKIIKLVVPELPDFKLLDRYVQKLENYRPLKYRKIDQYQTPVDSTKPVGISPATIIPDAISSYINASDIQEKDVIKQMMFDLLSKVNDA